MLRQREAKKALAPVNVNYSFYTSFVNLRDKRQNQSYFQSIRRKMIHLKSAQFFVHLRLEWLSTVTSLANAQERTRAQYK